jgi:hypothetical protein
MNRLLLALPLALLAATPAHATGGLLCRTAGPRPVEIGVGFGHVPGAPVVALRLLDNGRNVPVTHAQWWLDNSEVRLLLIAPQATREEALLRARRNGHVYDGSLWRAGKRRWVRCRDN